MILVDSYISRFVYVWCRPRFIQASSQYNIEVSVKCEYLSYLSYVSRGVGERVGKENATWPCSLKCIAEEKSRQRCYLPTSCVTLGKSLDLSGLQFLRAKLKGLEYLSSQFDFLQQPVAVSESGLAAWRKQWYWAGGLMQIAATWNETHQTSLQNHHQHLLSVSKCQVLCWVPGIKLPI